MANVFNGIISKINRKKIAQEQDDAISLSAPSQGKNTLEEEEACRL
jgi:hypothetical protein